MLNENQKQSEPSIVTNVPTEEKVVKKNRTVYYILGALILAGGIFLWKQLEIRSLEKKSETEKAELKQKAKGEILNTHILHMQILAKPLVWSVRTEILQNNISQVHIYLNELVKEKNFKNVMVANDMGIIVSSTNKKFEGQAFKTIADQKYLSINNAVVDNMNDSLLIMASPIMGFDKRLGTLMVSYLLPEITF